MSIERATGERATGRCPILGVVIPVLDDGRHVEALIRYWHVTLEEEELGPDVVFLIIDDSPAPFAAIRLARWLSERGLQATVHRQDPPRGPGAARQVGIELSSTEFVCFLDVDDRSHPGVFLEAAKLARSQNLDLVALGFAVESELGHVVERDSAPREGSFWEDLLVRRVGVWRFVFSLRFLDDVDASFPEWSYAEDLSFLLQCVDGKPRASYLARQGYTYIQHSRGLSGRRPTASQARRALEGLRENPNARADDGRYLRALWRARIAILGGWSLAPYVIDALPVLIRRPQKSFKVGLSGMSRRAARPRGSTRPKDAV